MNAESPTPQIDANRLTQAVEALRTYDRGSGRSLLLPIDDAVRSSFNDPRARMDLEQRLIGVLAACHSGVAREYVLAKLALIGSEASVAKVAAFLADPELATLARNTLEAIPSVQAGKALRNSLAGLKGTLKLGVIASLGARRDTDSVRALVAFLRDDDAEVAGAAAAALGDIGTSRTGKALRAFYPKAPEAIRRKAADAVLVCAERLQAAGKPKESRVLYQMLAEADGPAHIKAAGKAKL